MLNLTAEQGWRETHLGRLMAAALHRFDARVLELMARNVDVPLALGNLAARAQVGAAHIHITRHLPLQGARLTELAAQAGMSKQAMGDLVDQCAAWGMVARTSDPLDARAPGGVYGDRAGVAQSLPGCGRAGRRRIPPSRGC